MSAQLALFPEHTELQKKEIILNNHEENKANKEWLEKARAFAVQYIGDNCGAVTYRIDNAITTDDIRAYMGVYRRNRFSKDGCANNLMGQVFRNKLFTPIRGEYYKSKADGGHGNPIQIWTLNQAATVHD